jgi:hypothetical protein
LPCSIENYLYHVLICNRQREDEFGIQFHDARFGSIRGDYIRVAPCAIVIGNTTAIELIVNFQGKDEPESWSSEPLMD